VIADEMLPDGRGHAAVERAEELGIRAILMSGHPDAIRPSSDGNVGWLAKPFGPDEFEQVLRDNLLPP
jgi:DNA-binding NtrC family response regulator